MRPNIPWWSDDYTQYVDLFIGTEGPIRGSAYSSGNVFPGAALPFGAVKVGIDTTRWDTSFAANAGYTPDGNVTAITMLHQSGTGGAPTYGIVPQMPLTSLEGPRIGPDIANVGYYKTSLQNGIVAEMSATQHSGIMKYTYPANDAKHVLIDLSHFIPSKGKREQWYSNGVLERSETGDQYTGYGVWREGWTGGGDYRVYFCGQFNTSPTSAKLFSGPATDPYWPNATFTSTTFSDSTYMSGGIVGYQYADRVGALFEFPFNATTVISKVGVSWISAEKACAFLEDEIPHWDLNTTVAEAKTAWNTEVLSKIQINSNNDTESTMFYTALYHGHLLPSDRTGENPYWSSNEPYYDDFYTLWDTFRCLHSLHTLIVPQRMVDIIRSMIDIWRHERYMPEGRAHNHNGRVQGGSNSDNVLADAYVKGLPGINWTDGYAAMKTNAEIVPYNNFDFEDPSGSTKEGRGALEDWKKYAFVTPSFGRSLSKTVEYSLNDFALSQVARGEAPEDVSLYLNRSRGWQNLWDRNLTSLNFTGFLAPTYPNGSHASQNPLSCGACDWLAIAYEGVPWEYSWTIPFDMATLIEMMGGPASTERRLDAMFVPGLSGSSAGGNSAGTMIFNPGNEPSFMTPFLYNYLPGRQWKSVAMARNISDAFYSSSASGLPGNDDAGALSSWLVWNFLGLYPVVTQPVYLLLSPRFNDISMNVGNSTLRITADRRGGKGIFVQSVKVNGKPWDKAWVKHEDIVREGGASIEFNLGEEKVEWDTGDLPPSPGRIT
ncbi:glycoside hydrolase family 92 protein [Periconia macrospinosa]|uniref:Glycoside hydrolase family 92 protein n=1 Tax=Periconia macrospinosa TaxID=97972 RepID=A0A2V1DN00_9PLEO|nr:glycoside hydrolase family 92 protein [Periconia macrospinosa]